MTGQENEVEEEFEWYKIVIGWEENTYDEKLRFTSIWT